MNLDDLGLHSLSDLQEHGDAINLGDGRILRLVVEVDEMSQVSDFDCYGKVAWDHPKDGGNSRRPEGFDGNAEIWDMRDGGLWWQPPKDIPRYITRENDSFGDEAKTERVPNSEFHRFRELVRHLVEYGFTYVALEVLDGKDAYGHSIVTKVASVGGVDSVENGYLTTLVKELAEELEL